MTVLRWAVLGLAVASASALRLASSEGLREVALGRGGARLRVKRQFVLDPDFSWFNGKGKEYVKPGGVHEQTERESAECLYEFLEYAEKMKLRPRNEHAALLNDQLFDDQRTTKRLCFGYNKMQDCVKKAGKRGQRNGLTLIGTHPLFTLVRGVDWLCAKPQKRHRDLDRHRACFKRAEPSVRSVCDRKCKVGDKRFKGLKGLVRADATREKRVRTQKQFVKDQQETERQLDMLCSKAKCLLSCERSIVRRTCPKDLKASLFKLRFYKENLFEAKAEGDSRFLWPGVNFNGYWPPPCQDIQTMSVL